MPNEGVFTLSRTLSWPMDTQESIKMSCRNWMRAGHSELEVLRRWLTVVKDYHLKRWQEKSLEVVGCESFSKLSVLLFRLCRPSRNGKFSRVTWVEHKMASLPPSPQSSCLVSIFAFLFSADSTCTIATTFRTPSHAWDSLSPLFLRSSLTSKSTLHSMLFMFCHENKILLDFLDISSMDVDGFLDWNVGIQEKWKVWGFRLVSVSNWRPSGWMHGWDHQCEIGK